ncbi:MAG: DUF2868 domain-containing protein [Planctomycetota bacterium]
MYQEKLRFADLLTLSVTAQRDLSATRRSLHRRDRERFLAWVDERPTSGWDPETAVPVERVARWLREGEAGGLRVRVASALAWSFWISVIAAFGLGIAAALILFRYDGDRPINVLWVMLVFVALPLGTALISAVGMTTGWPRVGWTIGGGVWNWLWRRLAGRAWASAGTSVEALARTHAKVLRRALIAHAWWVGQCVGLAFVFGGTAAFAVILATSDLAFGWASTLELDRALLEDGLGYALWFASDLAPDAAMIEATVAERATPFVDRYAADPAAFKAWWQPLLVLVIAYGVVPRLLLTAVAGWRRARAVRRATANHPSVADLDARLVTPFVDSVESMALSDEGETSRMPALPELSAAPMQDQGTAHEVFWLRWAEAPLPGNHAGGKTVPIGGDASLADDRRAMDTIAEIPHDQTVCIAIKAWEPPLADFTDWLTELRQRLGDGRDVQVVAMLRGPSDAPKAGVWQRSLARLADPWLRVFTAEVASEGGA